jgi:hypothetical protein
MLGIFKKSSHRRMEAAEKIPPYPVAGLLGGLNLPFAACILERESASKPLYVHLGGPLRHPSTSWRPAFGVVTLTFARFGREPQAAHILRSAQNP